MKRTLILALAVSMMAASVLAVPYASRIRVGATSINPGVGTSITYFLNQTATSLQIQIVDQANPSNVRATFTGPATKGAHTVNWDGTANNAGGAVVPDGVYRVKITANNTAAAGWVEIASNSSVGNYVPTTNPTIYQTLWDGFSPNKPLVSLNPDSDAFGYVLCCTSYTVPPVFGHAVLNPDLSTYDGGDGQSTWLNFPGTPTVATTTAVWGNCFDPQNPDYVWVCGQTVPNVFYNKYNDVTLTDVTNGDANMANARGIAVDIEGNKKFAYVARGSSAIWKTEVTTNLVNPATSINVLGLADTVKYSKDVVFDKNGNLYWHVRYNNSTSGAGVAVYRWDAAQVAAATAGSLTEANSTWEVFFPTSGANSSVNGGGMAIAGDGNVYASVLNDDPGNDGSCRGIYLVGNISQAANKKTLALTDRVHTFYLNTGAQNFYSTLSMIGADIAGNVYFPDRLTEMIRCIGPEGNTAIAILGPTSQTLQIVTGPTSAKTWHLYE